MYDVIIIGSGIAGMTNAIYLSRYGLNVLMIEKDTPGGVLNTIPIIENYPGFEKIEGVNLAFNTYKTVKNLGVELKKCEVLDIINQYEIKIVKTTKGEFKSKYVVIATGRVPRKLGVSSEEKLIGRGVSYCATCDGPLYKNKDVVVVGGGNSALIESIYLSNICKSVHIIIRKESLKADRIYLEKLPTNITLHYNSNIKEFIIDEDKLIGVKTEKEEIKASCVFVFIGSIPSTSFAKSLQIVDNDGYIIVNKNMETKVKGIYAIGDVIKKDLYQIVTATSEGAIAANHIKNDF